MMMPTLFNISGKYFLRTRNIEQGKVSRKLQSPEFTRYRESCLLFDFFDDAGDVADLSEIRTLSISLKKKADTLSLSK